MPPLIRSTSAIGEPFPRLTLFARMRNAVSPTVPESHEVLSVIDCTERTPVSPACKVNAQNQPAFAPDIPATLNNDPVRPLVFAELV